MSPLSRRQFLGHEAIGTRGDEIGFVSHFWGTTCRARTGRLGSFRKNGFWRLAVGRGGIGFVSRNWVVGQAGVRVNWVRFA